MNSGSQIPFINRATEGLPPPAAGRGIANGTGGGGGRLSDGGACLSLASRAWRGGERAVGGGGGGVSFPMSRSPAERLLSAGAFEIPIAPDRAETERPDAWHPPAGGGEGEE
ncbi:hypothetical protein ANANG_G00195700 [Anguilla anguilla]|uniref:Uncharacterized protein n=1 Tax=Anguilla anguilla TaxID=7936 RepID=A0A9D3M3M6_ANGAN|nr:hypothetical protein ANANG_G00195700 [Anguilla anguilla]